MPKLSGLLAEKAKGEVQVGGAAIHIEFYALWRDRFSDDEWTALLAVSGRDHLKLLLPRIVLSWDIVDDDEHAIPVTAEAFDQYEIPDDLLMAIGTRVTASDLAGKARNSSNSHAT